MFRPSPLRRALVLGPLALTLCLGAGFAPTASAVPVGQPSPVTVLQTGTAALEARRPAVTDSARRAYRRWLQYLRRRAVADSITRADSIARAGGVPPAAATAVDTVARRDSLAGAVAATGGATPDYVAQVRANFTPENRAYATTRAVLGLVDPLYAILVGLFFLFSGLSAWMADVARGVSGHRYVQTLVYVFLFLVLDFVLSFPLTFYEGFALEHQYRLATQGFGPWLAEQGTGLAVSVVFLGLVPLVWLVYQAFRRFPRHWWVALGLGTLPVVLAMIFLQPMVVDPLFNRFTSLQDKQLEARILDVAARAGIPARHVFQMDASKQTKKYNAYVSGFGPSQRVVLYDNTLAGMTPDEILFVVAHEAGHYRMHHMWWLILGMSAMSFLVFGIASLFMRRAVRRWGGRWGFREVHDIASLPLFAVVITVLMTLAQPALNAYSRRIEREADTFALELTRANDAGARAFMKLGAQNRSDPDPPALVEFFEYSHPPLLDRVRFALGYRPWETGQPNRLFKPKS